MQVAEIISTLGPSRRAEVAVMEMVLTAEAGEADQFDDIASGLQRALPARLAESGLVIDAGTWAEVGERETGIARLAGYVCSIALALQNAAGHDLKFHDFVQDQAPGSDEWRYRFIFQHDDIASGEQAGDLAMRMVSELCPQLHWQPKLNDAGQPLAACIAEFIDACRPFVTPPETLGLMAAARARGIPVLRLEREPYGPLPARFRVAPNGMIMLGHSQYRIILDGLFCINRPGPGFSLMNDRRAMWNLLAELGIQRAIDDASLKPAASPIRVRRTARRLGYPLRIRPQQRDPSCVEGWRVENESDLDALLARPDLGNRSFLVEPDTTGPRLDLLMVGGELLAALQDDRIVDVDARTEAQARRIDQALNCGIVLVRFRSAADNREEKAQSASDWLVTDIDPSPGLATLLQSHPEVLDAAYEGYLNWLYPPGTPCRIPIVSVTGTNGKTTTSTMIARMAHAQSLFVGMARTTGVYFDQELKELGDNSGFHGHCSVFEHPEVELAVLETARGAALHAGFAFDYSDVAICTNVSHDHLGEYGVETVEDMAAVKRSIVERCTGSVVLNGDDPLCLDMLPHLPDRTLYLSTFGSDPDEMRKKAAGKSTSVDPIIHIDTREGEDWLVMDSAEGVTPVIAVNDIPATFNGAARHNISNAMHAVAAAHALGLEWSSIRQALANFEMGFESLPGRLNVHDNGRFHIIMDYAHNADGLQQLVRFTDQYPCKGRRILRFGVSPNASKAACRNAAATVAGHYDHYLCSGVPGHDNDDGIDTTAELRRGLLASGIAESQVEIFSDVSRSVEYPAGLCEPGDLLILVTSNALLAKTWEKILKT
ncbi:Mur ligase family protein [Elongatibacter sediminis]|uniref:Mur ligase family protein n=1 Tax=Elongatibacter sediminis TaxID=3119006 RepID=A0AAW9RJX7_9GAMM